MMKIITTRALKRRAYWVGEIRKLSGNFVNDFDRLEKELEAEIQNFGTPALVDHLRLCGNIPESYGHDTSEEKLYSKYTDALLALSYRSLGLQSLVLKERADAADVEVFAKDYSFVADAKCFRLSRTAKNQKDFKVLAMDGWKRGKNYAMVVCPIHQLPGKSSQIYHQATSRSVCVFTYSHLSLLLSYAQADGIVKAQKLLTKIFKIVSGMNPSKDSVTYWLTINQTMLSFSPLIENLWNVEKVASSQAITAGKEEALVFLAQERGKIMRMSHQEALHELIKVHKIESKIRIINSISDNGLFGVK